ncbi:hypothetical protein NC653_019556 [Populus alba x Populus x berolinensis]|uniref:Uncharacterized protein n=1 Tax=Populus alba x Populus x berolinensis TaxID=444605 RepID=A0AAD6QJD9_9ROSI|nr:hypothetical protein NC653_019556 [Populus alba x Populus x berolinensis]
MSDARVLAEQHRWAAVTDGAMNQTFNCTNGDGEGEAWDGIVVKYGLFGTKMEDIACFEALNSGQFGFLGYADTLEYLNVSGKIEIDENNTMKTMSTPI